MRTNQAAPKMLQDEAKTPALYCFCVKCGRPIPLEWYKNRMFDEMPPCCAACDQDVRYVLSQRPPSWPEKYFGRCQHEMRNGRAFWRVQVAAFEPRYFMTPVHGGFGDWIEE